MNKASEPEPADEKQGGGKWEQHNRSLFPQKEGRDRGSGKGMLNSVSYQFVQAKIKGASLFLAHTS